MIVTKKLNRNVKLTPDQLAEIENANKNFKGTGPDTGMKNPRKMSTLRKEYNDGKPRKTISAIVAGDDSGSKGVTK